ncbi:MAG: cyclic nucleotide-binding domain-containing protein [Oscillospiraceae bacterium]|nr:cyclic nucleotide-binding domain-containing protein [Oscillospiraceae bacterium]
MEFKECGRGEIIFREGDAGDCMYSLQWGRVGIYLNYGTADEKELAVFTADNYFGEMSLLDRSPRSATAVSLTDDTVLEIISEETFKEFFEKRPGIVLEIIQQMSHRLRTTTLDYVEACQTVYETVEAEKNGQQKSENLMERIKKFCGMFTDPGTQKYV